MREQYAGKQQTKLQIYEKMCEQSADSCTNPALPFSVLLFSYQRLHHLLKHLLRHPSSIVGSTMVLVVVQDSENKTEKIKSEIPWRPLSR